MMERSGTFRRVELGPEIGPPADRPTTVAEVMEMAERDPGALAQYFSDEDIRAIIPRNPALAEKIVTAVHRYRQMGGNDAA